MNRFPILFGVLRDRRKSLAIWAVALFAVSAMYIAFWPMMDGEEMQAMVRRPSGRWSRTGKAL